MSSDTRSALRDEVEREMLAALGTAHNVCADLASGVAVRLIERERRLRAMMEGAQRADIELRKEAQKRAKAAEKERDAMKAAANEMTHQRDEAQRALAERGHAARCDCHSRIASACEGIPCGRAWCRDAAGDYAVDPRCAPPQEPK